ncbi:hypothetical protein BBP07_15810 [Citrobacter koseri]|nr:hypothetical protein BBP07_15810 [Citrobacter koseri]
MTVFSCLAAGELPEDMADGMRFGTGRRKGCAGQKLFAYRNNLFADQHSQQAKEGYQRWGGGADIQQTVNNADKKSGTQRKDIHFHADLIRTGAMRVALRLP